MLSSWGQATPWSWWRGRARSGLGSSLHTSHLRVRRACVAMEHGWCWLCLTRSRTCRPRNARTPTLTVTQQITDTPDGGHRSLPHCRVGHATPRHCGAARPVSSCVHRIHRAVPEPRPTPVFCTVKLHPRRAWLRNSNRGLTELFLSDMRQALPTICDDWKSFACARSHRHAT